MERFGIFKKYGKGGQLWVAPAEDLVEAKAKMMHGAGTTGVEHFVYDFALDQVVATSLEDNRSADSAAAEA